MWRSVLLLSQLCHNPNAHFSLVLTSCSFSELLLMHTQPPGEEEQLSISTAQFADLCFSPFGASERTEEQCFMFAPVAEQCHLTNHSVWPVQKASSPFSEPREATWINYCGSLIITRSKINVILYLFQVLHLCLLQTKQSRDQTSSTSSFHWKPALFPRGKEEFYLYLSKILWIGGRRNWKGSYTSVVPSLKASPSGKNKQTPLFEWNSCVQAALISG